MKKIEDFKLSPQYYDIDEREYLLGYWADKLIKRTWRINRRHNKIEKETIQYLMSPEYDSNEPK